MLSTISSDTHKLRKYLRRALIISFVAALYLTGLFQTITNFEVSFSIRKILLCCLQTGINIGYFLLVFIILSAISVRCVIAAWKKFAARDKLGRNIELELKNQIGGNAHFADPVEYAEIAQIRKAEDCKGKILGQLTDDGTACIDWDYQGRGSPHSIIAGTTGVGKTTTIIYSYCLQAVKQRHSLIITDPKGELYDTMCLYLEDNGYVVKRFDLIDPRKSDGWDCMQHLRNIHDEFELDKAVDSWVEAIIRNISAKQDDVFARGSKALLKALTLYTLLTKTPETGFAGRNIKEINKLMCSAGVEFFNTLFGDDAPEVIKGAQNAYSTFKIGSPNLYGNICTHLATGLQSLQTQIIEDILSTPDIDLSLPAKRPCAYFCRFSPYESTYRFVSALFFTMLFGSLSEVAALPANKGKCPVPVDFVLDEFGSIGILPGWEEKLSVMRSSNISALMAVQSFQQIEDYYGTKSVTIIGDCGTVLNIGTNDPVTNKWFVERIGSTTVKTYNKKASTSLTVSEMESYKSLPLMSTDQIYQMCRQNSIIIFQGYPPIYAQKFHYSLHPEYKKLVEIKESDTPNFYDKEARAEREKKRQWKLEQYERTAQISMPQKASDSEIDLENRWLNITNKSDFEIIYILIKLTLYERGINLKAKAKPEPEKKTSSKAPKKPYFEDISFSMDDDFIVVSPPKDELKETTPKAEPVHEPTIQQETAPEPDEEVPKAWEEDGVESAELFETDADETDTNQNILKSNTEHKEIDKKSRNKINRHAPPGAH